jgi:hypothetical protein
LEKISIDNREYLSLLKNRIFRFTLLLVHATSLNQLLCSPGIGWMVGGIAENDEYKKDFEAGCYGTI